MTDHNGGACVGGLPQSAIAPPHYNGAAAYLHPANLPGCFMCGTLQCWIVTIDLANTPGGGFCLASDGNGSWSGSEEDQFTWAIQHGMDNTKYGTPSGPIISADPGVAPFGSCSYDIACGTQCRAPDIGAWSGGIGRMPFIHDEGVRHKVCNALTGAAIDTDQGASPTRRFPAEP